MLIQTNNIVFIEENYFFIMMESCYCNFIIKEIDR